MNEKQRDKEPSPNLLYTDMCLITHIFDLIKRTQNIKNIIKMPNICMFLCFVIVQVRIFWKWQKSKKSDKPSTRLERARKSKSIDNFIWSIKAKDKKIKRINEAYKTEPNQAATSPSQRLISSKSTKAHQWWGYLLDARRRRRRRKKNRKKRDEDISSSGRGCSCQLLILGGVFVKIKKYLKGHLWKLKNISRAICEN